MQKQYKDSVSYKKEDIASNLGLMYSHEKDCFEYNGIEIDCKEILRHLKTGNVDIIKSKLKNLPK